MRREAQLIPSDLTREPKPYSASVLDSRSSGKRDDGKRVVAGLARQSSGALPNRILKSGDSGYRFRLKEGLRTHRIKNVSLGAKGDYPTS